MIDNTPKNDGLRLIDKFIRKKFESKPGEFKIKQMAKTFILFPFELKEQQEKSFEEKESDALDLIVRHLINPQFHRSFVATSNGMDSVVMMDLVIRASKIAKVPIPDMFLNDTLNLFKEEKPYWDEIVEFLDIKEQFRVFTPPKDKHGIQQTVWTIAKKVGHLPSFRSMGGRGDAWKKLRKKRNVEPVIKRKGGSKGMTPECCNILKKLSMKKFLKKLKEEERYDLHFIGTRADESRMRAMSLLQRCRTYLITSLFPYPIRAVTPLSYFMKKDIYEYYFRYGIPKNPSYQAHNINRMGCASCPAHKKWEIRLAKDPTNEGFGMLKMNLKIMYETIMNGTEDPNRLRKSILLLQKYLNENKESLEDNQVKRLVVLIAEYSSFLKLENLKPLIEKWDKT